MTDVQKTEPAKTVAPTPVDYMLQTEYPLTLPHRTFREFDAFERLLRRWASWPATELLERSGEYEITAELPGLDEKDVEVRLANGLLTISGEKKSEREEKDKDYHFTERRYGAFRRAFRVPESVEADKIEASFEKGVLTVKLPKSAQAESSGKKIEIKSK